MLVNLLSKFAKNGPVPRVKCLHRLIYREYMKISSCLNHRVDILYIASPSGPLPSLFKLYPWGQKWPTQGITSFT